MSLTERSRRRIADALDRLRADYGGELDVVEKTWTRPPDDYEAARERFGAGTLGGAGCWVTDDSRVLLVRHEGEAAWSDPGGKQEPGESLEAAALRETREESGIDAEITGVRQVHRIEVRDANGERPPLHRLIVIFDAEYAAGEPSPREGEIAAVRWWSERPDELLYEELNEFPIPADEDQ